MFLFCFRGGPFITYSNINDYNVVNQEWTWRVLGVRERVEQFGNKINCNEMNRTHGPFFVSLYRTAPNSSIYLTLSLFFSLPPPLRPVLLLSHLPTPFDVFAAIVATFICSRSKLSSTSDFTCFFFVPLLSAHLRTARRWPLLSSAWLPLCVPIFLVYYVWCVYNIILTGNYNIMQISTYCSW